MKRIMEESLLRWKWNGREQEPFLCSGGDAEALLRGFLATMGGVDAARIPEYKVCAVRLEKIAEDGGEKADGTEG